MAAKAQHENTNVEGEENEGAEDTPSTLKEFLSKELGSDADTVHSKLAQMEITELDALLFIDSQDLIALCNELKLSFSTKIKFKSSIRKLQNTVQKQHTIVTIAPKEQSMINDVNIALKRSDDIRHIFEQYLTNIDDVIIDKKQKITTQINDIIKVLQKRETTLHQKLDEWKTDKVKCINTEISNITEYHNTLKTNKQNIDDLLQQTGVNKRERKMKGIVDGLFKNNEKYNKYQNIEILMKYLLDKTKAIDITFKHEMNMKQLNDYGVLDEIENNLFQIPSIVLNEIEKTAVNHDKGYKVGLNWNVVSNEEEKSNDFVIKYMVNDSDETEWSVCDDFKINCENGNKFTMNIDKYFVFDKEYCFMVEYVVQKPLNANIQSNVQRISVVKPIINLSKEEQILLNIHSHKGHHGDCVPERILQSNDDYYVSTYQQITNDWIILSTNNNQMYFPTKLKVHARGTKENSSTGDPYALKRFRLKLGDINSNEWIDLNEEIFTASKMDPNLQTFNLDIITNKNDNIIKKWKSIKNKGYKYYKLEILDNHGQPNFIRIKEFQLFGVKV